jgi:hypothetical protein
MQGKIVQITIDSTQTDIDSQLILQLPVQVLGSAALPPAIQSPQQVELAIQFAETHKHSPQ